MLQLRVLHIGTVVVGCVMLPDLRSGIQAGNTTTATLLQEKRHRLAERGHRSCGTQRSNLSSVPSCRLSHDVAHRQRLVDIYATHEEGDKGTTVCGVRKWNLLKQRRLRGGERDEHLSCWSRKMVRGHHDDATHAAYFDVRFKSAQQCGVDIAPPVSCSDNEDTARCCGPSDRGRPTAATTAAYSTGRRGRTVGCYEATSDPVDAERDMVNIAARGRWYG